MDVLCEGKIEEKEAGGRKYIDIVYRNCAREGFFADLAHVKGMDARYIIIECKNYGGDIGNPEIDQARGRMNSDVGNFAIVVCRSIADRPKLLQRIADAKRAQQHVMVLTDSDIKEIIRLRMASDDEAVDHLLHEKWREVLFN